MPPVAECRGYLQVILPVAECRGYLQVILPVAECRGYFQEWVLCRGMHGIIYRGYLQQCMA